MICYIKSNFEGFLGNEKSQNPLEQLLLISRRIMGKVTLPFTFLTSDFHLEILENIFRLN